MYYVVVADVQCVAAQVQTMTEHGHTYEKTAIKNWFRTHDTDPNTRTKLTSKKLLPNQALKSMISDWRAEHPDWSPD